ncbi:hypothetical protein QR98_0019380 [Sarcoptes scabiei]|uniref:Uncharacterized protein n=1 Tax=Sarcoptes scabiei TaxID=52283 RepID=A0A131ZYX2_SARSC|nr:hypothetical protein QR98_0019380 [Sarcoptes scabiei]
MNQSQSCPHRTRGAVGQFVFFAIFMQLIPYNVGSITGFFLANKKQTIKLTKATFVDLIALPLFRLRT